MYRVMNDGSVGCETPLEAMSLMRTLAANPQRVAYAGTNGAAKRRRGRKPKSKRKPTRRSSDIGNHPVSRLWAEARVEAEKQGRSDVRGVMKELAAKRKGKKR